MLSRLFRIAPGLRVGVVGIRGIETGGAPVRHFASANCNDEAGGRHATLVLLRHGQSTWNATPTFTGWCDAPLTDRGIREARASGELLRERGLADFDVVYASGLTRAIVTCELALEHSASDGKAQRRQNGDDNDLRRMNPIIKAWQLNERHYGALQGLRKDDPAVFAEHGEENLTSWRRDLYAAPPAMDEFHVHYAPPPAPLTESLADCRDRVLQYWEDTILPSLRPGGRALLVAHSNTLRGLVSHLDEVPEERVPHIHIPNSVPCVYDIDPSTGEAVSPLLDTAAGGSRGRWVFSAENHARLRGKVGGTGNFARSVFDAWDLDGNGVLDREEIEAGLRAFVGGDDVAVGALAGKILEEIDRDGNETLDVEEFEGFAIEACRKFMPGLMEEVE